MLEKVGDIRREFLISKRATLGIEASMFPQLGKTGERQCLCPRTRS